jgi:hypothetical protein
MAIAKLKTHKHKGKIMSKKNKTAKNKTPKARVTWRPLPRNSPLLQGGWRTFSVPTLRRSTRSGGAASTTAPPSAPVPPPAQQSASPPTSTPREPEWSIYTGHLTDAPGRDERWEEFVCKQTEDRWKLAIIGTSFAGTDPKEQWSEVFTTRGLVRHCRRQDAVDQAYDDDCSRAESRIAALKRIAQKTGDALLIKELKTYRYD